MLLAREGTLVSVTENLGRTPLLVEFEEGRAEYLFQNEVEVKHYFCSCPRLVWS
jgi:hypothetical protein